uniref:Uncharacterized protein n=1 Tax=Cacopsylla melanoneura TaxID=428564 RepID=A0A8D8ZBZ3_9HEMI
MDTFHTPQSQRVRFTRGRANQSIFSWNFTNDAVSELTFKLECESKKCLESQCQHIQSLIPIIEETLVLLDSTMTQSLEYQNKYETQVEKIKTLTNESKHLKQELSKERQAHQDTIEEGDNQIKAITNEKRSTQNEYNQLRQKLDQDKHQNQLMDKKITDLTNETKKVEIENRVLKNSIKKPQVFNC